MLKLLRRKQKQGGFTLLELLMVVIILAILASIALPQYIRAAEKARAAEAVQLLGAIRGAENRYRALSPTNVYTTDLGEIDAEMPKTSANWTLPPDLVADRATFSRNGGNYDTQTVSIMFETGVLCGTFEPMFGTTGGCP